MLDRDPADAPFRSACAVAPRRPAGARGLDRLQAPVVHQLRAELRDLGVQALGVVEEDAAVGRDRLAVAEQVLEHRERGAGGVGALGHLRELLGVAEQDDVPGGGAERERVGERDLARLVDEEVVEGAVDLVASEVPGGAGGSCDFGIGEALACRRRWRCDRTRTRLGVCRCPSSSPRNSRPLRRRPSRSRRAGCGSPCGWSRSRRPACPGAIRCSDQPRARVGLARAGRALDEEAASRDARPGSRVSINVRSRRGRAARPLGDARDTRGERRERGRGRRGRARSPSSPCCDHARGEAAERRALVVGVVGAAGDQGAGGGLPS